MVNGSISFGNQNNRGSLGIVYINLAVIIFNINPIVNIIYIANGYRSGRSVYGIFSVVYITAIVHCRTTELINNHCILRIIAIDIFSVFADDFRFCKRVSLSEFYAVYNRAFGIFKKEYARAVDNVNVSFNVFAVRNGCVAKPVEFQSSESFARILAFLRARGNHSSCGDDFILFVKVNKFASFDESVSYGDKVTDSNFAFDGRFRVLAAFSDNIYGGFYIFRARFGRLCYNGVNVKINLIFILIGSAININNGFGIPDIDFRVIF